MVSPRLSAITPNPAAPATATATQMSMDTNLGMCGPYLKASAIPFGAPSVIRKHEYP